VELMTQSSTEYRLIMAGAVGLCGTGAASSVFPVVEQVMTLLLAGAAVVAVVVCAVATVRRERRIRRRLAAIQPIQRVPVRPVPTPAQMTDPGGAP
jgi:hypothetical protein